MGTTTELGDARISAGDEVKLPGFGGQEAAERIRSRGGVPVPVDSDPNTYCIDPEAVGRAMTRRTAAVIAVELFGPPAPRALLEKVTGRHGIPLLQDGGAACASPGTASLEEAARRRNAAHLNARLRGLVTPATARGVQHAYTSYVVRVPATAGPTATRTCTPCPPEAWTATCRSSSRFTERPVSVRAYASPSPSEPPTSAWPCPCTPT